jgi:hypothetical protein
VSLASAMLHVAETELVDRVCRVLIGYLESDYLKLHSPSHYVLLAEPDEQCNWRIAFRPCYHE